MKNLEFGRIILSSCVAAAMLAGCGGSQPPIGAPGAMPQASAPAAHADRGKSWMLPEATSEDLLYVGNSGGDVYAYSWPQFKLVGQLNGIDNATEGLCVDKQGDVFVPAWTGSPPKGYVYEFTHGGTEPIATLNDGYAINSSCSVDPTTGNLAVTNFGDVAIYKGAQGNPTYYSVSIEAQWAAYDDNGNLFVDGSNALAELPKGSGTFSSITLNKSISTESLQWERGYLTIASAGGKDLGPLYIYRVKISGSNGTIVGATALNVRKKLSFDGNGQYWIQGGKILGAGDKHNCLQIWRYPAGGNAIKTPVKHFSPWGVVISK